MIYAGQHFLLNQELKKWEKKLIINKIQHKQKM